MKKFSGVFTIILILNANISGAFSNGSPVCDVEADYSNNSMNRPKFQNGGAYTLETNSDFYLFGDFLEITISGPEFTGLVVEVENAAGTRLGTFDFMNEPGIRDCDGGAMSATHTNNHNNQTSRTLFWVPPAGVYEDMYVQAYVLKGTRGNTSAQEFYRFARTDTGVNNALLLKSDVIFTSDLE